MSPPGRQGPRSGPPGSGTFGGRAVGSRAAFGGLSRLWARFSGATAAAGFAGRAPDSSSTAAASPASFGPGAPGRPAAAAAGEQPADSGTVGRITSGPVGQINFYDRSLQLTRDWLTAETAAGAMLSAVAIVALATWQVQRQTDALQAPAHDAAAALEAQQAEMLALTQRLAGLRPDSLLQRQLLKTQTTLEQRQAALQLLGDGGLGPERGYANALQAFARQSIDGLWLTGLLLDRGDMALRGRALRPELIPAYVGRLNDEPALQGHSFRALDIRRPEEPVDAARLTQPTGANASMAPAAVASPALADAAPSATPATAAAPAAATAAAAPTAGAGPTRTAQRLAPFVEFSLAGSGGAAIAGAEARP